MKHPAIQQYQYHKWANNRVLEHLKELPDEVFGREIKSVFPSIQEVIVHIYQVDAMWLSVMSGDDFSQTMEVIKELKQKSTGKDLGVLSNLYEEVANDYENFLDALEVPDKPMTISHPKYGDMDVSVAEMLKHVINHGTYHRGNITAMLRQQGHAGVPTDYIIYLYKVV